MKHPRRQTGFTLIAAIFLLVVVAGLVVYMANMRTVQQTTLVYGVQGARAFQAARSGIEWGIYQALVVTPLVPGCPAAPPNPSNPFTVEGFQVTVTCSLSTHIEAGTPLHVYRLEALAQSGTFPSLDFVQRRIRSTVSLAPP